MTASESRTTPSAVKVVIPALNEEGSIAKVISAIPLQQVQEIIVIDNGSSDATADRARDAGATVLQEAKRGYGACCLAGISYIKKQENRPDIVVFMDGDYSDYPEELPLLIAPIEGGTFDMVIGSRTLGKNEKGSLTPQQIFGNKLATFLIRKIYGIAYTDLGPFRAIRYTSLTALEMRDQNYGWTVEMQIKAIRKKLRITEVAVSYRKRIGISKVSGTVKGSMMAGIKIIWTILRYMV